MNINEASMNTNEAISNAFSNLAEVAPQVYDYWISELYTVDGDIIAEEWNESNLNLMEKDVTNLSNV